MWIVSYMLGHRQRIFKKKLCSMKLKVIPVAVCVFLTVLKVLGKKSEGLEIGVKIETTALLRSA